jgi:hypothetical protein
MTVYQKCLYCDQTFEIGPRDYRPMKRHVAVTHPAVGGGEYL